VTLEAGRPQATLELLDEVGLSVPASMVDRFTRLVDDLLE
jgi:3-hydroxyacyl-CoA dehydrogenase